VGRAGLSPDRSLLDIEQRLGPHVNDSSHVTPPAALDEQRVA
jgi:hypothetical protein